MPCGCAGSLPRQSTVKTTRQERAARAREQQRQPRAGGPGEAGYTWNGPRRRERPVAPAAAE